MEPNREHLPFRDQDHRLTLQFYTTVTVSVPSTGRARCARLSPLAHGREGQLRTW
jgi:hypothetical protein